jgi:hypothetical protein
MKNFFVGFEVGRSALRFCHNLLYEARNDGMIDEVQMIWKKVVFVWWYWPDICL